MIDDPKKWRISFEDNDIINLTTFRGRKCYICRERGHSAVKCPKKFKPIKCSLCGGENHMEPRCPNKLCTQVRQRLGHKTVIHSFSCFLVRQKKQFSQRLLQFLYARAKVKVYSLLVNWSYQRKVSRYMEALLQHGNNFNFILLLHDNNKFADYAFRLPKLAQNR